MELRGTFRRYSNEEHCCDRAHQESLAAFRLHRLLPTLAEIDHDLEIYSNFDALWAEKTVSAIQYFMDCTELRAEIIQRLLFIDQ